MAAGFDPYYTWLAIPPEDQPPTPYRVLGVRPFEDNAEVIEHAADQRMAHLRAIRAGKHVDLAQRLLNEVAAARIVLLNPKKRAVYDAALREKLEAESSQGEASAEVSTALGSFLDLVGAEKHLLPHQSGIGRRGTRAHPGSSAACAARPHPSRDEQRLKLAIYAISATAALLLVAIGVAWIVRSSSGSGPADAATAALVFDWPPQERKGLTLHVDDRPVEVKKTGPLVCECKAGTHRVVAVREGYKPLETTVEVKPGERHTVSAAWESYSYVSLRWPSADRRGARLTLDGDRVSLRSSLVRTDSDEVRLAVDAGAHRIRIERPGYESYEQEVQVLEADTRTLRPEFKQVAGAGLGEGEGEGSDDDERSLSDLMPTVPDDGSKGDPTLTGDPEVGSDTWTVPERADEERIAGQLDDVFRTGEATTESAKAATARMMLAAERKYRSNPHERYVLLKRAMSLAAQGGEPDLALEACDMIAADYDVDALRLKAAAVEALVETASTSNQFKGLCETARGVTSQALAEEEYDLASELADRVYQACSRSQGRAYRKEAYDWRARLQDVIQEHKELESALAALEKKPDDVGANQVVGAWYCLRRGDWESGLVYLAQGTDEPLRRMARRERDSPPREAAEQIALADAWWDLAEQRKGDQRSALMLRAGHWYRQARAGTSSTVIQEKASQRLATIDKIEPPLGSAGSSAPRLGQRIAPCKWVDLLEFVNTDRDALEGEWRFEEGRLVGTSPPGDTDTDSRTRIVLPVIVEGSYDLDLGFSAGRGGDTPVALVLPVADRHCAAILMGWQGNASGLERIEGKSSKEAGTMVSTLLEAERTYRVSVQVRLSKERLEIRVSLDGEPHLQWSGTPDLLDVSPQFRMPERGRLGLAVRECQTRFEGFRFRLVQGTATLAASPSRPVPPIMPERSTAETPHLADGNALSPVAIVTEPAAIPGVRSWTIETIGLRGEARSLCFHPSNSDLLATGSSDAVIRIWDLSSGKLVKALLGHARRINDLAWSPDGESLASAGDDGTVRVWDVATGETRLALADRDHWVSAVAWSPDGSTLATAGRSEGLHFYDAATGRLAAGIARDDCGDHYHVAWSPDGRWIASGGSNRRVSLWDGKTYRHVRTISLDEGGDWSAVGWTPDSKTLIVRHNGVLCFFDPGEGKLRRKVGSAVWNWVVSPDSRAVTAVNRDKAPEVFTWDIASGDLVKQQDRPKATSHPVELAASADGRILALSSLGGVQWTHADRAAAPQSLAQHPGPIEWAEFAPNGRFLASAGRRRAAQVWDVATGRLEAQLDPDWGANGFVRYVAWSPDGGVLTAWVDAGEFGNTDSRLYLWDVRSGAVRNKISVGFRQRTAIAWHRSGKAIAYAGGKTQLINPIDGKRISELETESISVAWSPDGQRIATRGGGKDEVCIYDPASGRQVQVIKTPKSHGRDGALAWSPDGEKLACGFGDSGACICDVDRATVLVRLEGGHTSPVRGLLWLDDGKTLLTGAERETCVWEAGTGKPLRTIAGGGDVFSPDGKIVARRGRSTLHLRAVEDGRARCTILSLAGQQYAVLSPEGHWRGSRNAKRELVCVVWTDAGQETLTPDEFSKRYNWRNSPSEVKAF